MGRQGTARWAGPVGTVAALALGALAAGCARANRPDPFLVPAGAFHRLAQPVVLAPTLVPEDLAIPESVPARIDSLVAAVLDSAGIPTVPSNEFVDMWQQILDEVGGIADAESGERDSLRYADAMDLLRDELWQRHRAGSILYLELVVVSAPLYGGKAEWDGATRYVVQSGFWADLYMLLRGRETLDGWVDALSLWATVETVGGVEIYASAAGLQPLQYFDRDALKLAPIPSKAIGESPDQIVAAVQYALAPLLDTLGRTAP